MTAAAPARCCAPGCAAVASVGPFCAEHSQAPRSRRGGWISAARRKPAYNASQVSPRLWVGGAPPADRPLPDIEIVVLCAQEYQPEATAWAGRVMRCPFQDGELTVQQLRMVMLCAVTVAQAIANGRRVLVTCDKGLNRSALIAALAIGQLTTMSARQIVELARERRPGSLANAHFVAIIERMVGDGRPRARPKRVRRDSD